MPTPLTQLDAAFRAALLAALGFDADPLLGPAQNAKFGDYQSNAAMGLAKRVAETTGEKANPRAVAERVVAHLDLGEMAAEKPTIAGPGFINVRIAPAYLAERIEVVAADAARLGVEPVASPQTVVIDYSAPNVAKQMHVGNARSTILGDAISRVLAFDGDRVIRQNHIGDWGTQFGMLVAFLQAAGADGADAPLADLDAFYKQARQRFDADPAFADEARATVVRLQAGGAAELAMWRKFVGESRRMLEATYARLGILLTPADERGESFYNPMLPAVVADLRAAGVARTSEGAVVVFTDGVEAPLIVEKTGGGHGYATTDLAAIRYRVGTLKADRVLYFVGSTQAQHFRQVFAAARQAGWAGAASLEHAAFGSILGADGKMFKARSGDSVKLADLLDEADRRGLASAKAKDEERVARALERGETEVTPMTEAELARVGHAVGVGALKYADLSKDRIGDYTFDWDTMLATDGNTAPYLQYAYARIQSIFRRADDRGVAVARPMAAAVTLEAPQELTLAKTIVRFGDVVDLVARELKPHFLCAYLYDLATAFSGFFENCPVLTSDDPVRSSRLTLCEAAGLTLATGLNLLGIEHPEQM